VKREPGSKLLNVSLYYNNFVNPTDGFSVSGVVVYNQSLVGESIPGMTFKCIMTDLEDNKLV
jgi:hypothetical protein